MSAIFFLVILNVSCTDLWVCELSAKFVQMDRSWVHCTLFSDEYVKGVNEFMNFILEKFGEEAEILCPCSRCLNQKDLHQSIVHKHILLNGMDSTYTRWVNHGEDIDVDVNKNPVDMHDNDYGAAEDDSNAADRFGGILRDLHTAEERVIYRMVKIKMETSMLTLMRKSHFLKQ